ncbi:MAG: glycosyltransferase [Candidatus Krumholzibacteria bacterium]|nr:glycosyltransferase [Candidatus Krumholzibacteria bacterium]
MADSVTYDIAAVVPGVGVFGGVRRFIEIGNELVRRGHRYTLYHPGGAAPEWLPFAGQTRALDALAGARHQVLLCNDPPLYARVKDTPADLKLFYFVLEGIPDERRIVRGGWTLLANSEGMHRYLRRRYGANAHRVVGGIDPDTFQPRAIARDDNEVRILAYGRASRRRKGLGLVVRAVESFARRAGGRLVRLVLFDHVGPGNERDPRDGFHCRAPHEWHLNLAQADLARLYASCDVFVSAEKRAGWANTVAEAMACGAPVVCTRSGARDLARHHETAWVVPLRHPFFLRRGLEALTSDAALAARLREAALAHVRGYAWPRVVDQLLAVIASQRLS